MFLTITAFLSFYIYNLSKINSGENHSFFNSNNSILYIASLCVFAFAFIASCVLVYFVPYKATQLISSKKLSIPMQVIAFFIGYAAFVALTLNYLLVIEVENPPYAMNYATIFSWRQIPLVAVISYTVICVVFVLCYSWKNKDIDSIVVYFGYAIAVLLVFIHNLYLNNFDEYHHAAVYDSVYNCYHGVPFDRFTTGIYGHYGIFIGLFLRLVHGNAITMFYVHAFIAALEMLLYICIIHGCVSKNYIRIISALAAVYVPAVLCVYVHWQSIPIRNLPLLLIIAYTVWCCRHKKFTNKYIFIGYLIAALGIVWSTDSGIYAVISFTAAVVVMYLQKYKWYEKRMLMRYALAIGLCIMSVVAALAFVNIYNLICGGKLIFKAFFYPLLDEAYMKSWGASGTIKVALGNQAWIFTLVGFAVILLLGLYYTKIAKPQDKHLNLIAPVYTVVGMCGLTMYFYYASRPVYVSLDIVFYFACIAVAVLGDKFVLGLSDVIHVRDSFFGISRKCLGVISISVLTILASQTVFTVPNLINKQSRGYYDSNTYKTRAQLMEAVIPEDAMIIGCGTSSLKLQLDWSSPYYYRHNDMMASGTEYCEKLIDNAKKCDYVAFSILTGEDKVAHQMFLELAPEYDLISVNRINGRDFYLYSTLENYTAKFLGGTLSGTGEYTIDGSEMLLKSGAIQCGPYMDMKPGNYNIKIQGSGLNDAEYDVLANSESNIPLTEISRSNTEIQYHFTIENTVNIEFRILNYSENEIVVKEIQLSSDV